MPVRLFDVWYRYSVLEFYKQWLLFPFSGSLSKESWFHGDLTKEEAEDLLKEQKPGTFLIRFGDSHTSYYCSYVAPSSAVVHAEIQSDHSGVMPQEQKGTSTRARSFLAVVWPSAFSDGCVDWKR